MRILYVEDERGLSEAVVDILTYHHYTVDAVYDGETALAYAQLEEYDGIILDIMMPDKSGLEVLKELIVCFKTIKVTKQGYRQDRQQRENRVLSSHIWWQNGGCFSV